MATQFAREPGPIAVVFLDGSGRHGELLIAIKGCKMITVRKQSGINQGMTVAQNARPGLRAIGELDHNVRRDLGPAGQHRGIAANNFHRTQAARTFASARQFQVEDARPQRCSWISVPAGTSATTLAG